jgi:hypothetical protein
MISAKMNLEIRNALADIQVVSMDLYCTCIEENVSDLIIKKYRSQREAIHKVNILLVDMLNQEGFVSGVICKDYECSENIDGSCVNEVVNAESELCLVGKSATYINKLDICMEYADTFEHDGLIYVTTEFIVGNLAGRSFSGKTKEDAIQQMIEYFDREIKSEKDTLVKRALQHIEWHTGRIDPQLFKAE